MMDDIEGYLGTLAEMCNEAYAEYVNSERFLEDVHNFVGKDYDMPSSTEDVEVVEQKNCEGKMK